MQLYLLLNNICNLNCSFCIRGKQSSVEILDVGILKEVLKKNDFSQYYLLLTGGEPSLHSEFADIIALCKPHFRGISVNTNGVESSWIDQITDNDIHVQISLDGTKEYHNSLRGGRIDVYDSILCTIEKLNEKNIRYNISTTVNKKNYENVKLLCKQMTVFDRMQYWKVSSMLPFGCASKDEILSCNKWNNLVDYLLDESAVRLKITKLFDFKLIDRYLEKNISLPISKRQNCGDVRNKIYVYPDFTVYPCTCLVDFPLGNLNEEYLETILENDQSKMFSEYKVRTESICAQCKYLGICNGGCIGMSYHFHGKLGMGDFRCPLISKK